MNPPRGRGRAALIVAALVATFAATPAGQATAQEPAPGTRPTVGWLVSSNQACTATVVTSTSRSLVVTAAHCVYYDSGWHLDDARFLPGYHDQQTPYGQWAVQTAWVPTAWQSGGGAAATHTGVQPISDIAFLRLAPDPDGRRVQDVLGSQGIRFDAQPGGEVSVLGYPGERGFDGEQLVSCTGTAEPLSAEGEVEVGCRSGKGASGGPWLSGQTPGAGGAVVAVISGGESAAVFGHLFDGDTERLYQQADQSE